MAEPGRSEAKSRPAKWRSAQKPKAMNLTIDIGNTCAKLVVFDGGRPIAEERIDDCDLPKLAAFAARYPISRGIYSTVLQLSDEVLAALAGLPFPLMRLQSGVTPVPVAVRYSTPLTLGSDRLAAVVGAWLKSKGKDILVIDLGTCITYDFVNSAGEYLGGNISPGPSVRLRALHRYTSALPRVSRRGERPVWGHSTETAIRCGVLTGVEYELRGYIADFRSRYPDLVIYLTGGVHLDLDISDRSRIFTDDYIVPEGLNAILEYNND